MEAISESDGQVQDMALLNYISKTKKVQGAILHPSFVRRMLVQNLDQAVSLPLLAII